MTGALLTIPEVAETLGRSHEFVRGLIADGLLEGRKLRGRWYVSRAALDAWLSPGPSLRALPQPGRRLAGRQDARR